MSHEEKAALRRTVRALRSRITPDRRALLDAALIDKISATHAFLSARALIAYWPTKQEINLVPLIEQARMRGIPVYLPRTEADGMHFYRYEGEHALFPDRYGIPSPVPQNPLPEDTEGMLCILPGLAADRQGCRLGYGGGYYDRFLTTYRGNTLFPLYDCFLLDTLPHEPHDIKIPWIITEKGEYRYGKMDTAAPTV